MALFYQRGTIHDMTDVQSGKTASGGEWQRMNLILETPGYQGATYKVVFQVFGDHVKETLLFNRGDKVEVGFSVYAREWNGKWYNNLDLVSIKPITADAGQDTTKAAPQAEVEVADNDNDLPF